MVNEDKAAGSSGEIPFGKKDWLSLSPDEFDRMAVELAKDLCHHCSWILEGCRPEDLEVGAEEYPELRVMADFIRLRERLREAVRRALEQQRGRTAASEEKPGNER